MIETDLLKIRERLKSKKPKFIRQDAHKKSKLGKKWRKPKGLHSKIGDKLKSYRRSPSKGWKSPKATRYMDSNGLIPVLIKSMNDINNVNKEKQGIIISKSVGAKKKVEVIKKALESNITILNVKNPDQHVKKIQEDFEKRKQEKKEKIETKVKKKKEAEKKKETKKDSLSEKITEEEKKKQEKKEKDKLLTKKE